MYEWLLKSRMTQNTNVTYSNMHPDSAARYYAKLLLVERKAAQKIESLMDALETELIFMWDSRTKFSEEDRMSIEEAYVWMKKDGRDMKKNLLGKVRSVSQERAATVFEQSMDRLMYHLKRKQQFWRDGSDLEIYLEWLLELPYFVQERLESASALVSSEQHPIIHHETQTKVSTSVYRGNIDLEESGASSEELALCC